MMETNSDVFYVIFYVIHRRQTLTNFDMRKFTLFILPVFLHCIKIIVHLQRHLKKDLVNSMAYDA